MFDWTVTGGSQVPISLLSFLPIQPIEFLVRTMLPNKMTPLFISTEALLLEQSILLSLYNLLVIRLAIA